MAVTPSPIGRTQSPDTPVTLSPESAHHYRWDDLPAEPLKGTISRRLITGERMMIAHVYLKKGDDVPRHAHENEQLTYVLKGALQFWLGAHDERELIVRAGEVLAARGE